MLSEEKIRERVEYCYCVYLQLSWLRDSELVEPAEYWNCLQKSSLQLSDDEFIRMTINDALLSGQDDGGLTCLIDLYQGFIYAFCEVMQIDTEEIEKSLSRDLLKKLTAEVKVKIKSP
ncbi:MAG: hypothetical protein IMF10_08620 [Proteobacteria bacterium]|nr:hypothetical protein [Pseudomonadota bacterium]